MSENKKKSPRIRQWVSVAQHLSAEEMDFLLAEAQERAKISLCLEKIKNSHNRPLRYLEGCFTDVVTFIRAEWVDKGYDPRKINDRVLVAYDPHLLAEIHRYEGASGPLPKDVSFRKSRSATKRILPAGPAQTLN